MISDTLSSFVRASREALIVLHANNKSTFQSVHLRSLPVIRSMGCMLHAKFQDSRKFPKLIMCRLVRVSDTGFEFEYSLVTHPVRQSSYASILLWTLF